MDRVLLGLVLVASIALIRCHGGDNVTNPSKVVCYSGGVAIAEYYVPGIVWRGDGGYSFAIAGDTAVNTNADCIIEEIK